MKRGFDDRGRPTDQPHSRRPGRRLRQRHHLVCRECGAQTQLGPYYACPECFGPLEVGYDFPTVTREQIEAGPRNIWRYRRCCRCPPTSQTPNTEPGFTRLVDARNLAASSA